MWISVSAPAAAVAPPDFDRAPRAHEIRSDAEAIEAARTLAAEFAVGAAKRDPVSQIIQAAVDAGIARGAIDDTIAFVRRYTRPWIDSGQERGSDDVFTIAPIGDLKIKLHAAEALLERAGRAVDAIIARPTNEGVGAAAVAVAEAKALTTGIAILASNKLHELAGTGSTLAEFNLDRYWRNARTHTVHDPVRWKYRAIGDYWLSGINPTRHGAI
jgi:alkylation response protein AidB-like acyl-CoA dehydrogenase